MNYRYLLPLAIAAITTQAGAQSLLGTAANFAVLGGSTVTNTGSSVLDGDLGVSPGSAITGFPPGIVHGTIHANDGVAQAAQADALGAWVFLGNLATTQNITGSDLGARTLTPGVYAYDTSAQLTGTLTLDFQNDPNAMFVFKIGSTLTTASSSVVRMINGGDDCNIYWRIGSSATLGTTTSFMGSILADQSITLTTGANIQDGRALAIHGAATLDTNHITICAVPEPGGIALFVGMGLQFAGMAIRRRRLR